MNLFLKPKIYIAFFLFVIILFSDIKASADVDSLLISDNQKVKIDSLHLRGNDITEDFIILRELNFQAGDSVSGKQLRYNRERVISLGIFSRVDLYVTSNEEKNIAVINVKESWYIYPIPIIRFREHDIKKANYGVSLLYKNFRGRNETLRAMFGFGYDPFYSLLYQNPALIFKDDIGLYIGTSYSKNVNRSETAKYLAGGDFNYKFIYNSISVQKRINQFNDIIFTIEFNYVESDVFNVGKITASGQRVDRVPIAGVSYTYDSRDLKQYSLNGLYAFASFMNKGFDVNNVNYETVDFDFREYRKFVEDLSGRWRLTYRGTFGESVPYYDYSFLGNNVYVRGHSGDYREGNNSLLTSFELSYPFIKDWNFSIKLPFLPERLTSARIGIYLSAFVDYGGTFNNSDKIYLNGFYSGYGIGITILAIPYNGIRFEYAFNENGRGEFLIGTGFSF